MDLQTVMGSGNVQGDDARPGIEYTAQAASPLVSGEVKLAIGDNSFSASALFDAVEIPFAEVNAIVFANYVVTVHADSGDFAFSRMGEWAERFYDALLDAYNKAVLRSLFVSGEPAVAASGGYSYSEGGKCASGDAPLRVYENSVAVLPPDLSARRVPLCFVAGIDIGDYAITLRLTTGESYTFSKLGYETAPVEAAVEKHIRALREKAVSTVKEIDPTLTAAQASQLAGLLPEGAAAQFGRLAAISPSFAAAVESRLAETRAAQSFSMFKELCDYASIYVGFRKNEAVSGALGDMLGGSAAGGVAGIAQGAGADSDSGLGGMLGSLTGGDSGGVGAMLSSLAGDGNGAASQLAALTSLAGGEPAPDEAEAVGVAGEVEVFSPYLFWLIAPSPDGQFAAVEFAEANSATFVYRTGGDFPSFAQQLNRALEAISFKREVVRLTEEELRKPENASYYMAAKRTAALQFVRARFVGRVIHSSTETWKRKLLELWSNAQVG